MLRLVSVKSLNFDAGREIALYLHLHDEKIAIAFLRLASGKALGFDEEREIAVYLHQQDEKIAIFSNIV